jgi:DinB superfamily
MMIFLVFSFDEFVPFSFLENRANLPLTQDGVTQRSPSLLETQMKISEFFAESLAGNSGLLKMTLNDFTDAEMLVRPCEGANNVAWQLGHLVVAEASMIEAASPGKGGKLSDSFKAIFAKDNASSNDPGLFPSKAEIMTAFDVVRTASIEWAKGLNEEDLPKPGPEKMRAFIPTIGALARILLEHTAIHVGQFQVIRRKLGKPHTM